MLSLRKLVGVWGICISPLRAWWDSRTPGIHGVRQILPFHETPHFYCHFLLNNNFGSFHVNFLDSYGPITERNLSSWFRRIDVSSEDKNTVDSKVQK